MNLNKIEIMNFKPSNMAMDATIVMIAKRASGKSFVVRDLVYNYRKLPGGVIIAPTDQLNPFYKYFFPDIYIHHEINPEVLKKIMARQATLKCQKNKGKLNVDPSMLLIMDDCLADAKAWSKDKTIREILMNGRHYKITYILTMQTPLGIGPELRLNFDYIFLLKEQSIINRKKLHMNYASIFPNLNVFNKFLDKCTEDYRCMVIDARKTGNKISDTVYWYKAKDRKFTFGSKQFKQLHKKYYDPDFLEKKLEADFGLNQMMMKKKNEPNIGIVLND